jgi:hypothetical protein
MKKIIYPRQYKTKHLTRYIQVAGTLKNHKVVWILVSGPSPNANEAVDIPNPNSWSKKRLKFRKMTL